MNDTCKQLRTYLHALLSGLVGVTVYNARVNSPTSFPSLSISVPSYSADLADRDSGFVTEEAGVEIVCFVKENITFADDLDDLAFQVSELIYEDQGLRNLGYFINSVEQRRDFVNDGEQRYGVSVISFNIGLNQSITLV